MSKKAMTKILKEPIPYKQGGVEVKGKEVFLDWWKDSLFGTRFVVTITADMQDLRELLTELVGVEPGITESTVAFCWETLNEGRQVIYICFTHLADPNTIAHESVHAVNRCLAHVGVQLQPENDEVQAYMLGNMVEKIHGIFTDFNKKQILKKWHQKRQTEKG